MLTTGYVVAVAVKTGGAPGPTCETRSTHFPLYCRGISVASCKSDSAIHWRSS